MIFQRLQIFGPVIIEQSDIPLVSSFVMLNIVYPIACGISEPYPICIRKLALIRFKDLVGQKIMERIIKV